MKLLTWHMMIQFKRMNTKTNIRRKSKTTSSELAAVYKNLLNKSGLRKGSETPLLKQLRMFAFPRRSLNNFKITTKRQSRSANTLETKKKKDLTMNHEASF